MKKSTVAAGCIAGVVAACSGAGLEAIGDTMHDAGHAMAGVGGRLEAAGQGMSAGAGELIAGAGRLMAGAGSSVAAAGSSLAAGGSAGTSGAKAQESTADGLPHGHWVLRDASGSPVVGMVYPMNVWDSAFRLRAAAPAHECVGVDYLGEQRVGFAYRLDTGKLAATCNGHTSVASYADAHAFRFTDSACSGTAYADATVRTAIIAGKPYYADADAATTPGTVYSWQDGSCAIAAAAGALAPLKPIPAPYDALPHAPYTLELVY